MVSGEIKQEKKPGSIFTAYHEVKQTAAQEKQKNLNVAQTEAGKEQKNLNVAQNADKKLKEVDNERSSLMKNSEDIVWKESNAAKKYISDNIFQGYQKELIENWKKMKDLDNQLSNARTREERAKLTMEFFKARDEFFASVKKLYEYSMEKGYTDVANSLNDLLNIQKDFDRVIMQMMNLNVFSAPERGFLLDQQMFERSYPAIAKWIMTEYLSEKTTDEILKTIDERRELLMESVEKVQNGGKLNEEEKNQIIENKLRSLFMVYYCSTEKGSEEVEQKGTLTVLNHKLGLVPNLDLDSQSIPDKV
jgi:hypothetical protein